jgi:hypothetical protein
VTPEPPTGLPALAWPVAVTKGTVISSTVRRHLPIQEEWMMGLSLWITAGLLAVVALTGGISKTFVPKEKLATVHGGGWTADASVVFVKTLGVLELLAAAGLILPAALDIAPVMVPVTAVCWVLLMVGAMRAHGRRHEHAFVVVNLLYLGLAAFIAWRGFASFG